MKRLYSLLILFALSCPAYCEPPPAPIPAPFILPIEQRPNVPTPDPSMPIKLSADLVLMIGSNEDGLLIINPPSLVKVTVEDGPITVRDRFADSLNPGKRERRTYATKTVYTMEAAGVGTAWVVFTSNNKIIWAHQLTVDNGAPPIPPNPPDPKPPIPPTDPFFSTLQTAFSAEPVATRLNDTKQLAALYRAMADPDYIKTVTPATAQGLRDLMHAKASMATMVDGRLMTVRRALADESNRLIKVAPSAPLDVALQSQYVAEFVRFSTLLEALAR